MQVKLAVPPCNSRLYMFTAVVPGCSQETRALAGPLEAIIYFDNRRILIDGNVSVYCGALSHMIF